MKIIFDSEEQKDRLQKLFCPREVAFNIFGVRSQYDMDDCESNNCEECWEKSEIEMEVRE